MRLLPQLLPEALLARIKLTDRSIQALKARHGKRLEIYDAICPALHLRVTPRGVKTFSVVYRHGKIRRKTLGRYPALSLANARSAAMSLLREASRTEACDLPEAKRLSELISNYTSIRLQPNVRSWRNIQACLSQTAMNSLHPRDISLLTTKQIVAVLDGLVAAGKPHGAANLLRALRAMFNWAVSRGEMTANPCALLRPPITSKPRDRVLSDIEIVKVMAACAETRTPFTAMVQVLLLTGARRNEVAHLQWSELADNVWTIPASRAKNGKANVLPLPVAAMNVIRQQPRGNCGDFVFTTTAGAKPSSNFAKCKKALDEASGVAEYRLHDLRRVARTKLSQLQVPWEVARRILGHSVDALDATYDRFDYRTAKAQALAKLAAHLEDIRAQSTI